MKLQTLRGVSAAMALAVIVGACSSGSATPAPATDAPATPVPATPAPATEAPATAEALSGEIVWLVPNATVTRWASYDQPQMEATLKSLAPGMTLKVSQADDSVDNQLAQCEAAVAEGAKAIIMTAVDPTQSAGCVDKAHAAGIKVIAYAHESNSSDVDFYVTVPFEQIGEVAAQSLVDTMNPAATKVRLAKILGDPKFFFYSEQVKGNAKILDPLIAAGQVEVVCEADSLGYTVANAQTATEQCLTKVGDGVDAIIGQNDSTLEGAIAALTSAGLAGKVKVFGGYDAEVAAIQYLLVGYLENTMRPPYENMGPAAIKIALAAITGDGSDKAIVNGVYANGTKDVPTAFIPNVTITKDNVQQTLIDPGIMTKAQICDGVAKDAAFCK